MFWSAISCRLLKPVFKHVVSGVCLKPIMFIEDSTEHPSVDDVKHMGLLRSSTTGPVTESRRLAANVLVRHKIRGLLRSSTTCPVTESRRLAANVLVRHIIIRQLRSNSTGPVTELRRRAANVMVRLTTTGQLRSSSTAP